MRPLILLCYLFGSFASICAQTAEPAQPQVAGTPLPVTTSTTCSDSDNHKPPTVAWTVLPEKVVKDNFGQNVSHNYVAIDVTIRNNNCSNQLVVKTFVFKNIEDEDPDLTTDPDLVKGSIAKGHEVGMRNRIVSSIKTFGLIGTGAAGYFKTAGASATFNRGLTIFSDPFEKGIELIFPDTTVKYLANWDENQVFKNGFIVSPNTETRGRVFMPLDFVCEKIKAAQKSCRSGHRGRGPVYDPAAIKASLGHMRTFRL
jgi:hypothetical protein